VKVQMFIMFLVIMLLNMIPLKAQSPTQAQILGLNNSDLHASIFAGYFTETRQDGFYEGAQISYKPLKLGAWGGGVYFMGSHSSFQNYTLDRYKGQENNIEQGIQTSYWRNLNRSCDLFVGLNIGGRYSASKGESWGGKYQGKQKNILITSNLNINLLRMSSIFPRTQLLISAQRGVEEMNNATWNGDTLRSSPWIKDGIDWTLKSSIIDFDIVEGICGCGERSSFLISPKLILGGIYDASYPSAYKVGAELGFHKRSKDDFISLYFVAKFRPFREAQFTIGLNIGLNNF